MGQFRGIILVSLAIMTLNSCNAQTKNSLKKQETTNSKMITDTISISTSQYSIITNENGVLDIRIKDEHLLQSIKNANQPILKIELEGTFFIAKGNDVLSSSTPKEADYFYPLGNNDKIVFMNEKEVISLRRIR